MPIPVVALIGPTAVGKTALSLDLARALDGEVISVDSRQVYRYMDVGTDKIDGLTRKEIIHHLLDVVDPDEIFNASDFVDRASSAIDRILARGRTPILVGGTAFYYRALFDGILTVNVPSDPIVRKELMDQAVSSKGRQALHDELKRADPQSAQRLHPNDSVRVIRALEVYRISGRPLSWWHERPTSQTPCRYSPLYLGLIRPRDELTDTIARRVREQFGNGYPEEVRWLLDKGFPPDLPSMKGFGYRELVLYHQGHMTFDEAVESDVVATRQFAKRQMTWFRTFFPVRWYDLSKIMYNEVLLSMLDDSRKHLASGDLVP
ncbi:MAG: tRNA (adenosine(37)-N6)-dimethylallyltransferase MiaA [Dethiosulfovibrio peptidovorans]|nr:MAG: tRNA (adenosine(37)-N6)-dimethylallyltransferase MiaA [Dethiosulfovibrio peptidovorans]